MSAMGVQRITSDDHRYPGLVRGNNARWSGTPDTIYVPETRADIAVAFREMRQDRASFAVRGGGHCYLDSVYNDRTDCVMDLGLVNQVFHDQEHKAISVDAGSRLGEVYKHLYRRWGVTIPGGSCATVGVGGHVSGGGYGLLSRLYGITVDYLWGVEVVTASGEVKLGTRDHPENSEEHRLWWCHTGGGGGNFGVVTRFLFRSANSDGTDPTECLPPAPAKALMHSLKIPWGDPDEDPSWLSDLLGDYASWCADRGDPPQGEPQVAGSHADIGPDTATNRLFGLFRVRVPRSVPENWALDLTVQVAMLQDTAVERRLAERVLDEFRGEVIEGAVTPSGVGEVVEELPWLVATEWLSGGDWYDRAKQKSAYHLSLTEEQGAQIVHRFHEYEGATGDHREDGRGALAQLDTYGGAANHPPHGTAQSHRDSTIKVQYQAYWHGDHAGRPVNQREQDLAHVRWLNSAYHAIYATGGGDGFPQRAHEKGEDGPCTVTDGCFVNYLDDDLVRAGDEQLAAKLYWAPRTREKLIRCKAQLDPERVFSTAQDIPGP